MCRKCFSYGKANKQTKNPHDNPANKLDLFGTLQLGIKQKKAGRQDVFREENWEKDEQVQLLSGEQEIKTQ